MTFFFFQFSFWEKALGSKVNVNSPRITLLLILKTICALRVGGSTLMSLQVGGSTLMSLQVGGSTLMSLQVGGSTHMSIQVGGSTHMSIQVGGSTHMSLQVGGSTHMSIQVGGSTHMSIQVGGSTHMSLQVGGSTLMSLQVGGSTLICQIILSFVKYPQSQEHLTIRIRMAYETYDSWIRVEFYGIWVKAELLFAPAMIPTPYSYLSPRTLIPNFLFSFLFFSFLHNSLFLSLSTVWLWWR